MTVTTEFIGKLGGGGGLETKTQSISGRAFVSVPQGWTRAAAVFEGVTLHENITMFGKSYTAYIYEVTSGAFGKAGQTFTFNQVQGTITLLRLE